MDKNVPYVLTISRQFGSGGAYLGQRLATRLNILYLDREILQRAAKELGVPETVLEHRDEKVTPRWKFSLQAMTVATSWIYTPPSLDWVVDKTLYDAESEIIRNIAQERSAVIIGRGGYYILRQHPRCLNISLHASIEFRQLRVQELYQLTAPQALKLIHSTDKERARYLHALTGHDCQDVCQYHVSLDTSVVGLEKAEDIILATLQARFGDIVPECEMEI